MEPVKTYSGYLLGSLFGCEAINVDIVYIINIM